MSRARAVDPVVIDWVLAGLLTAGALAYAALLRDHRLSALATASCVVITGSVAWRRYRPALTTLVALTALLGLLVAVYYLVLYLMSAILVPGYASTIIAILVLGDSLFGPSVRRAMGLGANAAGTRRFRRWLTKVLERMETRAEAATSRGSRI